MTLIMYHVKGIELLMTFVLLFPVVKMCPQFTFVYYVYIEQNYSMYVITVFSYIVHCLDRYSIL